MAKDKTSEIFGGELPASNLTLYSTAAAGSGDYISFKTGSQTERLKITGAGVITLTGAVANTGALNVTGDFSVATNKFTTAAATGNTVVAGTLGVTGDVAVNTNKFTVTASSGNTVVAGSLTAASVAGTAVATQSDQETATSTTTIVTPGRQQFHPSAAKFWGKATVSGGTPTLQVSYNVTSITDTDVGRLTVTIATDFSSADWVASMITEVSGLVTSTPAHQTMTAGTILFQATTAAAFADPLSWSFAGYGDQ